MKKKREFCAARLQLRPRDFWIGIHWKTFAVLPSVIGVSIYIALVPCLPLNIEYIIRHKLSY